MVPKKGQKHITTMSIIIMKKNTVILTTTNIIMSMNMLKNMYILMKKCIFILMRKDIHTIMTMRIAMHMVIIPIQVLLLFWSRFQSWI